MSNVNNNVQQLRQYVEKIAKQAISNSNTFDTVVTGTIKASYSNYYKVTVTTGDSTTLVNAFSINNDSYDYQQDDYVYLVAAREKEGETRSSVYYILGLVENIQEDYINTTDLERFLAGRIYNIALEDNTKTIVVDDKVFIQSIKETGLFKISAAFCYTGINSTDKEDFGIHIEILDEKDAVLETCEFNTEYFDGQPFKSKGDRIQQRLVMLSNTANIVKIKLMAFGKCTVGNLSLQSGSILNEIESNMKVKIAAIDSKDYFLKMDAAEQIQLKATATFNGRSIYTEDIHYYWFVLDAKGEYGSAEGTEEEQKDAKARTVHFAPKAEEGGRWLCINKYDNEQGIDNSVIIQKWDKASNVILISGDSPWFKRFANMIKCVIKYQGTYVESDVFEVYNYAVEEYSATISASVSPAVIVNETDKLTLTCEVINENKYSPKDVTYKYQWQRLNGKEWENIESFGEKEEEKSNSSNILIIKDSNTEIKDQYEMNSATETIRCQVEVVRGETVISTEISNEIVARSLVGNPSLVETKTYYKYWITTTSDIVASKSINKTEYLPTLDTVAYSGKTYYKENTDNTFEEDIELEDFPENQYEQYMSLTDWSVIAYTYTEITDVKELSVGTKYYTYTEDGFYRYAGTISEEDKQSSSWGEKEYYTKTLDKASETGTITEYTSLPEDELSDGQYLICSTQNIVKEKVILSETKKQYYYNTLRVEDWTKPQILRRKLGDNIEEGSVIDKLNTFNELTAGGDSQGLFNDKTTGDVYINAEYIKTGSLTVGDGENIKFQADIDSNTIKIGGFKVDGDAIKSNGVTLSPSELKVGELFSVKGDGFKVNSLNGSLTYLSVDENGASFTGDITVAKNSNSNVYNKEQTNELLTQVQVFVVYSNTQQKPDRPTDDTIEVEGDENIKTWHTDLREGDVWMCQKVDSSLIEGSRDWGSVIQMAGLDGKPGNDGTSSKITKVTTYVYYRSKDLKNDNGNYIYNALEASFFPYWKGENPVETWTRYIYEINNDSQNSIVYDATSTVVPDLEACTMAAKYQILNKYDIKWTKNSNPYYLQPKLIDKTKEENKDEETYGKVTGGGTGDNAIKDKDNNIDTNNFPTTVEEGDVGRWCKLFGKTIISGGAIVTGSITADSIAANSITGDKIAANSITANKIAANSITANKIAANSITADKIAANSITADKISVEHLSALAADIGGWKMDSTKIYFRPTGTNFIQVGLNTSTGLIEKEGGYINIWAGEEGLTKVDSNWTAPFYVTNKGKLFANKAEISGTIVASSGSIGGFHLTSTHMGSEASSENNSTSSEAVVISPGLADDGKELEERGYVFLAGAQTDTSSCSTRPIYIKGDGSCRIQNLYTTSSNSIRIVDKNKNSVMELSPYGYLSFPQGASFGFWGNDTSTLSRVEVSGSTSIALNPSISYVETQGGFGLYACNASYPKVAFDHTGIYYRTNSSSNTSSVFYLSWGDFFTQTGGKASGGTWDKKY